MDTLVSLKVFCLVVELKSFSSAARRLGISTAMASKHVMHLERRLNTRLLNRTSRSLSLTESGALYFDHSRRTLNDLEDVEAAVTKATVVPRGILRISAPVWLANPSFVGVLADYQARYPDVQLDIDLSGRIVNLVEEGFDLALRVARTLGDSLIARPDRSDPWSSCWLEPQRTCSPRAVRRTPRISGTTGC
jgi:DNA-binding transcriptional LysR family regulator